MNSEANSVVLHNHFHMHSVPVLVDPSEAEQYPVVATCLIRLGKESSKTSDDLKSSTFWDTMQCITYFKTVSCLASSSTLKREATCSSKMLVDFQQIIRHYIPEDRTVPCSCQELNPACSLVIIPTELSQGFNQ